MVEECIYSLIDFLVDPVLLNNGLPFILLSFHRPKSTSYVPEMTLLDVDALKLYRTQIIQNPVAFEEDELPYWGTCCSLSLPCIHFVCGKVEEGVNDQTSAEVIVITKLPGCHAYRWHQSTFHYHHWCIYSSITCLKQINNRYLTKKVIGSSLLFHVTVIYHDLSDNDKQ